MKCCSRSTFGVIIGTLSIFCCIGAIIYLVYLLSVVKEDESVNNANIYEYSAQSSQSTKWSLVLVVMPLMIIISGLLIIGIVKRRYKLMLPWLFICVIGFVAHLIVFLTSLVRLVLLQGFSPLLRVIFFGAFIIGLQASFLWAIYTLYRDKRIKNDGGNVRGIRLPEVNLPATYWDRRV